MKLADFYLFNKVTNDTGKYINIYSNYCEFSKNNRLIMSVEKFPLEFFKSVAFFLRYPVVLEYLKVLANIVKEMKTHSFCLASAPG